MKERISLYAISLTAFKEVETHKLSKPELALTATPFTRVGILLCMTHSTIGC